MLSRLPRAPRARPIDRANGAPSWIGALTLCALAIALPIARGGVDPWSEATALVLAVASVTAAMLESPALARPVFLLAIVVAVEALQLLPVPAAVHAISPAARRVFEVSLGPLGLYPSARSLSLAPAESARELVRAIACTCVFAAACTYGGTRRRRTAILVALASSGVVVAGAVLVGALAGRGALLAARFPFVNPNHLAGFLNLTSFIALGLAIRARGEARVLWAFAFVTTAAGVFLSLSRAGIGAFLLGVVVVAAFFGRTRSEGGTTRGSGAWAAVTAAVAAAVCTAGFLALDPIVSELRSIKLGEAEPKLHLLRASTQVVLDSPWIGIGRGAFETTFPAYLNEPAPVTFTHLENEWVQAVVDLGVPAGLLLVGTFAWIWVAAARRQLSGPELGLLAGTGALAAQNALDFSFAVLGVAAPFAISMGLLVRSERERSVAPRRVRIGIVVAAACGAAALALSSAHRSEDARARLSRASGAADATRIAGETLRWHPADWMVHAQAGAAVGAETGCRDAMPWLMRAMALNPAAAQPHLAAARCLAGRDDRAAKREYRLAILFGAPALDEAARRYPRLADLLDVAPGTPDGFLSLAHVLASAARLDDAKAIYDRVLAEFSDARALLPLSSVELARGDRTRALALARSYTDLSPSRPDGWLVTARLLVQAGQDDDAVSTVERGLAAIPGSPELLGFLAERAMAVHRWSEARRLAEQIGPRSPAEIARKHLLVARALAGQGRIAEALERARSAAAADGDAPAPWQALADYAELAAQYDEAIGAIHRLDELPTAWQAGVTHDQCVKRVARLEASRDAAARRAIAKRSLAPAFSREAPP